MRRVQSDEELQKQVPELMADPFYRLLVTRMIRIKRSFAWA